MCGPSSQEKLLSGQSANFASILQGNYGTLFGNQSAVLAAINKSLSPILAAGPSQQGFSAGERAALNTQAINSAGAASRNAQQAAANFGAGQGGGGTSGLQSGIQKQIQGSIASASAGQLATAQNQITQADYNQGTQNYWRAAGGMQSLAEGYSPNAAQGGAISENQAAFGQAQTITEQQNQKEQAIAGGIVGLATSALTFGAGGLAGMGASAAGASQPGAFLSGGLSALGGRAVGGGGGGSSAGNV
jgi:hypothetical protein